MACCSIATLAVSSVANDGRIAVDERNRRCWSDGFEIGCDNGRLRVDADRHSPSCRTYTDNSLPVSPAHCENRNNTLMKEVAMKIRKRRSDRSGRAPYVIGQPTIGRA